MKIYTGVQAILRFCLSNLNVAYIGNTDRKEYKVAFEMGLNGEFQ
jgi:hypothetical protein